MAITKVICIIVNHTVPNHEAILRRTLRYSLSRSQIGGSAGKVASLRTAISQWWTSVASIDSIVSVFQ